LAVGVVSLVQERLEFIGDCLANGRIGMGAEQLVFSSRKAGLRNGTVVSFLMPAWSFPEISDLVISNPSRACRRFQLSS
jgi:hypothetical protein